MTTNESTNGTPAPAPPVDLMEELGLRIRVSFPDFVALPDGPQAALRQQREDEGLG